MLASEIYNIAKKYAELAVAIGEVRLSPSQFGIAWALEQEKHSDILCMRPTERTGLSLSTLHEAFYQFQQLVNTTFQESPERPETIAVAQAADSLTRAMGNPFETETKRTKDFNTCLGPLFASNCWTMQVSVDPSSEQCNGVIDAAFRFHYSDPSAVAIVLREDKREPGSDGDPYMQIARGYHLYAKALEDRKVEPAVNTVLSHGAPMFLLCVQGEVGLRVRP